MGELARKSPVTIHALAMHHLAAQLLELLYLFSWQHEIVPGVVRCDLDGELREFVMGLVATGSVQRVACDFCVVVCHGLSLCDPGGGVMNLSWRQTKLTRQFLRPRLSMLRGETLQGAFPCGLPQRHIGHGEFHCTENVLVKDPLQRPG